MYFTNVFSICLPLAYLDDERILLENVVEYENQQWEDREGEKESCIELTELTQTVSRNVG